VILGSQKIPVLTGQLPVPAFKGPQRKVALQLCGWGFDSPKNDLASQLTGLEISGFTERAASLAIFHLDLRRAIKSLSSSPAEHLKLVSLALAGYTEDSRTNPLWKESVAALTAQFQHPYLKAIFTFLTSANPFSVLDNDGLSLSDRVGFACRFLDDRELPLYIKKLTDEYTRSGNVEGILLTGLTKEGIDLFEVYIDSTGDVQTPTLVLSQVVPKEFKDKRAEKWLDM